MCVGVGFKEIVTFEEALHHCGDVLPHYAPVSLIKESRHAIWALAIFSSQVQIGLAALLVRPEWHKVHSCPPL